MALDELYENISGQNFKALGTLFLKPISRQRRHSNNQSTDSSQTTADVKPRTWSQLISRLPGETLTAREELKHSVATRDIYVCQ